MSEPSLGKLGEFGLIEQLRARLGRRSGVEVGIGDDAAVLSALSSPVVTSDALVEGVHFRRDWTPARSLGRKCLAVNVSDIAAMGGTPVAAFINLTVSPADDAEWLFALYDGFEDAAREGGFTIAGGDMSRTTGGTVIGVTLVGNAPRPVLRSGARASDALIVTGFLGESAAGLWLLQHPEAAVADDVRDHLVMRHFEPEPRVAAMQAAISVPGAVHAALDISDGLAGDAAHIAKASGVALTLDLPAFWPSHQLMDAARAATPGDGTGQAERWALYGGEDYELLMAVAPESVDEVIAAILGSGAYAARVGSCLDDAEGGVWLDDGTKKMRPTHKAWTHF